MQNLQPPELERIVSLDEQDDSSGNEKNVSLENRTEMSEVVMQRVSRISNEDRTDDEEEDIDEDVDIEKTKEGLWTLLTGQY
jgi:hypothetical protein